MPGLRKMCREMSEEGYRVVSLASSPCRTNFYGGECRTFFRRRKKMFRAENLKRYKGKSSDCGTPSGLFLLYPFSSDSSALRITFFSGNSRHSLLRRNSSVLQGKMLKIRMAEGSTPEGGGRRCLRGEMRMRGWFWYPGRRGKQVAPR